MTDSLLLCLYSLLHHELVYLPTLHQPSGHNPRGWQPNVARMSFEENTQYCVQGIHSANLFLPTSLTATRSIFEASVYVPHSQIQIFALALYYECMSRKACKILRTPIPLKKLVLISTCLLKAIKSNILQWSTLLDFLRKWRDSKLLCRALGGMGKKKIK